MAMGAMRIVGKLMRLCGIKVSEINSVKILFQLFVVTLDAVLIFGKDGIRDQFKIGTNPNAFQLSCSIAEAKEAPLPTLEAPCGWIFLWK